MEALDSVAITLRDELKVFDQWMDDPDIEEIAVNNDPNVVFVWKKGIWESHKLANPLALERIIMVAGNYTKNDVTEYTPIMSGELPCGSRIEITTPPVCQDGHVYINIRKHKSSSLTLSKFQEQGYFKNTKHCLNLSISESEREKIIPYLSDSEKILYDYARDGQWIDFIKMSQKIKGLNGIVSGCMGTGKTTFLQALIDLVNSDERIITVEDSKEIKINHHKNYQQLFFKRKQSGDVKKVGSSPTEVLMSSLRKTPNRVYLGELRGAEALNFIEDVANIGLNGSLTTVHSSGSRLTFTRLASLVKRSDGGKSLGFDEIYDLIYPVVNYVIQIAFNDENKRHCEEIYYDPIYSLFRQGIR